MKNISNKKAVNVAALMFAAMLVLSMSFVTAISDPTVPLGDNRMKVIVGTAVKCSGGPPTTGSPVSATSSLGTRTSATLFDGTFQVDISGSGPEDPDWPDGTTFTLTITDGTWSGSKPGTVSGTVTNVGTVTLYPPTLVADASANPTTIIVGGTVQFTGSATGGAQPYTWDWNFGDGSPHSSQQSPTHVYTTTGTKTVVLTVTDACSSTDTDTVQITVNSPLSCSANGPYSGYVNQAIQFTGTASGGIPPYTWSWTFGDGGTSPQQNPSHTYTSTGTFPVTLTVTDSQSNVCNDGTTAQVTLEPVVAHAGGPYSGTLCAPVQFHGSATGGSPP